ncbi:hypothetical protein H6F67_00340 [Microcoleus sp. FACHB-1515]|uniref:hypothetical protein n=1 Tax=Cyanophyceae TaxID=3028117 RepID=UPI0016893D19|nr:hypothetical protein [Microcoleus sp. FACHB-1515]MBD2088324.1 hypothetical protein [Microcoleus sp. FACHB-1515]
MNQVKGVPAKRVFPGAIGLYLEFFSEADADRFYQRGLEKNCCMEQIDRVTVVLKFSHAAKS